MQSRPVQHTPSRRRRSKLTQIVNQLRYDGRQSTRRPDAEKVSWKRTPRVINFVISISIRCAYICFVVRPSSERASKSHRPANVDFGAINRRRRHHRMVIFWSSPRCGAFSSSRVVVVDQTGMAAQLSGDETASDI